jgi:hypothetical protein
VATKQDALPIVISLADYYMGRDLKSPEELTAVHRANAQITVDRVNELLEAFGEPRRVNSGWRPAAINAGVPNAAAKSKHMTCQACDLSDDDGSLDAWCMANLQILERIGLWLEHPDSTPRWTHWQIVPPGSGNRVFRP